MIEGLDQPAAPARALIVPDGVAAAARADATAAAAPPGGDPKAAAPASSKPAAPVDYGADARELLDFSVDMLGQAYPSLPVVWSSEVRGRVAVKLGAVFEKYGVTWAELFGRFAPEIGLALALAPVVGPTIKAIKADHQAAKGGQGAAARPAAAQPAAAQPAAVDAGRDRSLGGEFPGLNASPESAGAAIK